MEFSTLDLGFRGHDLVISVYLVPAGDGFVLLECGPSSTLVTLERCVADAGYPMDRLKAVFLTHVHLDHAAGAGSLARAHGCPVYAHPKGVPHLVDPHLKLVPSAERLYGAMTEPLWGRIEAVPDHLARECGHGETVKVAEVEVTAWHAPGHATHHLVWQVDDDVVTGDVAGVRFPGSRYVVPPMPPPDIDVEQWRDSLDLLRGMRPRQLLLTHFGAFDDVADHLDQLERRIVRWGEIGEQVVAAGGDQAELAARLLELDEAEMADEAVPDEIVERFRRLCPMDEASAGLYRYHSRRAS
jgi:glyoxylase-like metal-dependent hydrolase (beta-lactamase superfamily II)